MKRAGPTRALGLPRLLLLAFGAATCTSQDQPEPAALADALARAFCTHQFACCAPAEIAEVAAGRYLTEDDCITYATLAAKSQLALLDNAVASGHITVDATAAETCLSEYATSGCNVSVTPTTAILPVPDAAAVFAACTGLLVGQVPAGALCAVSEECAPGTHCTAGTTVFSTSTGGVSGGTGTGTGVAGNFGTTGSPATGAGVCVTSQELGDPCNQTADCDQQAHLSCSPVDFTCIGPAGPGEHCGFDVYGNPAIACDPAQGLRCDPNTLSCRRAPGAGEPCNFALPSGCDPDPTLGLACNGFTGLCAAPGKIGDACGGSALAPCRADLECVPTQSDGIGTCQAAPALGEPCRSVCQSPAACDGSVCRAIGPLPVGATCSTDEDCLTLACVLGAPVAGRTACISLARPVICAGSSVTPGIFGSSVTGTGGVAGTSGAGGKAGTGGVAGRPGTGGGAGGAGAGGPPPPPDGGGGVGGMTGADAGPLLPTDGGGGITGV